MFHRFHDPFFALGIPAVRRIRGKRFHVFQICLRVAALTDEACADDVCFKQSLRASETSERVFGIGPCAERHEECDIFVMRALHELDHIAVGPASVDSETECDQIEFFRRRRFGGGYGNGVRNGRGERFGDFTGVAGFPAGMDNQRFHYASFLAEAVGMQ